MRRLKAPSTQHGLTVADLKQKEAVALNDAQSRRQVPYQFKAINQRLILLAYRHGFRVSELVGLQWSQVDLKAAPLHVRRAKHGTPSVHPLTGRELRALRGLQRQADGSPFVFNTERGATMTTDNVRKVLARAATEAKLEGPANPHALRHACGFTLANKGTDTRTIQAYLGHRSIQHTVRYTELAPGRFKGLFAD